ncbi:MAG: hypothetical protein M9894_34855 [Planctomycetes bacterium]|nr:hypothetical protein [Planctomycetota bacterium]
MRPLLVLVGLALLGPVGCVQAPPRPVAGQQQETSSSTTVAATATRGDEGLTLRTAAAGWGQRQRDLAR